MVLGGWASSTAVALVVLYGLYDNGFGTEGTPMSKAAAISYLAVSRVAWSLAIAWVVFACATG